MTRDMGRSAQSCAKTGGQRFHPYFDRQKMVNALYDYSVPRWVSSVIQIGATALLYVGGVAIILMQFVDPADQQVGGVVSATLGRLNENRFLIVCAVFSLEIALRLALFVSRRFGRLETPKVRALLDALVYAVFPARAVQKHSCLATLFKFRRCDLWGWWTGIDARSGHTNTRRTTIFSLDPNDRSKNTGFAGECWWQAATLKNLALCRPGPVAPTSEQRSTDY
jgi:hypothetical protein